MVANRKGGPVRPNDIKCGVCGLGDEEDGMVDEVADVRLKKMPRMPSEKEIEEHNETHLPFRTWCETCVAMRAKDDAHKEREVSDDCFEVHMDYCFLRNKKGEEYAATLVLRDRRSKILSAHVVPNKGASVEWVIRQTLRDLEKFGHAGKVLIRSDGEPALVDLISEIANLRKGITLVEHTPPVDSEANGFIERGIQTVEEMVRVYTGFGKENLRAFRCFFECFCLVS